VSEKLGGLNAAPCIIHSFNMQDVANLMNARDYTAVSKLFCDAAIKMKADGAEGIVICANTMHMFAGDIEKQSGLPVISLVTATAKAIEAQKLTTIGLLGTRPTMDLPFYKEELSRYKITTLLPTEPDKDFVHETIFSELSRGIFTPGTRAGYTGSLKILLRGVRRGSCWDARIFPRGSGSSLRRCRPSIQQCFIRRRWWRFASGAETQGQPAS
jgi:aspartate racemase